MAETYIAAKPVWFDREYAVGEVIPGGAVDPKMAKRLVGWGKISPAASVPLEVSCDPGGAELDAGPPFRCGICGKECAARPALTAHMKTHGKAE